ncbi:hypothetical protein ACFL1P_00850 [Patescibacteria group bacterium]
MTKKKKHRESSSHYYEKSIPWLPIDSRLIPDVFSFERVGGISKVFLIIELLLSVLVVIGTIILLIFQFFGL